MAQLQELQRRQKQRDTLAKMLEAVSAVVEYYSKLSGRGPLRADEQSEADAAAVRRDRIEKSLSETDARVSALKGA